MRTCGSIHSTIAGCYTLRSITDRGTKSVVIVIPFVARRLSFTCLLPNKILLGTGTVEAATWHCWGPLVAGVQVPFARVFVSSHKLARGIRALCWLCWHPRMACQGSWIAVYCPELGGCGIAGDHSCWLAHHERRVEPVTEPVWRVSDHCVLVERVFLCTYHTRSSERCRLRRVRTNSASKA